MFDQIVKSTFVITLRRISGFSIHRNLWVSNGRWNTIYFGAFFARMPYATYKYPFKIWQYA
jgi:hypothetical protein